MNNHFQSSETAWTLTGLTDEAIGLGGSRSYEPIQATIPVSSTVISGIDQTNISMRPESVKSGRYVARLFDARNQKAIPSVAMTTGITIASMMPVALKRICRSARAIGPLGSSTPSQPPSVVAASRTAVSEPYRISALLNIQGAHAVIRHE